MPTIEKDMIVQFYPMANPNEDTQFKLDGKVEPVTVKVQEVFPDGGAALVKEDGTKYGIQIGIVPQWTKELEEQGARYFKL